MVQNRRKNIEIRKNILKVLSKGQLTVNEISSLAGVNWKTVDRHLTYLKGHDLVKTVFSSRFVRIYELTEIGKDYVEKELKMKLGQKKVETERRIQL